MTFADLRMVIAMLTLVQKNCSQRKEEQTEKELAILIDALEGKSEEVQGYQEVEEIPFC